VNVLVEHNLLIFLIQLVVLLFVARAAGELFRFLKQPALVGEILVGIIFGPTILGRFLPGAHGWLFPNNPLQHSMLETVSWLGVLFLLLITGFEVETGSLFRHRRPTLSIGVIGVIVPLILGAGLAMLLPDRYLVDPSQRLVFALYMGTAVSISAIPVISKVLHDLNILKSDFGNLAIAAYTVNDILGWVAFTLVLGLATQQSLNWISMLRVFGGTTIFVGFALTLGRRWINRVVVWLNHTSAPKPGIILTFILLLGGLCGIITQMIGIHAAFGFLVAGIVAGSCPAITEHHKETISQMMYAVFVPLFFVTIGLRVDFLAHFDPLLALAVTLVAVVGKSVGAWIGAIITGIKGRDAIALGVATMPGGAMEILIGVLALEFGLINLVVFEAVVVAAIVSSVIVGPLLTVVLQLNKSFNPLEYFLSRAVVSELSGNTPRELIKELCTSVSQVDHRFKLTPTFARVMEREMEIHTGLEMGVAVPHAALPWLSKPVFTFGRSLKGVDWNTPDGMPVRLVFLIFTPDPDADENQVRILAAIARASSKKDVREKLITAGSRPDLVSILESELDSQKIARV